MDTIKGRNMIDARSLRNITTLHRVMKPIAREFIERSNAFLQKHGLTVRITDATRTLAEQKALYQKFQRGGPQAAPPGKSCHNFGLAFDVALFDGNEPVWESPLYDEIAPIGRALGLTWGGDWHRQDKPHYEFRPSWAEGLSEDLMLTYLRARLENGLDLVTGQAVA